MLNKGIRLLLSIICSVGITINASAQYDVFEGIPYFQTYTTRDYPGEQQMFDAIQWHDGSMLFANAGGLVQHADDEWRVFARFDATFISELELSKYDDSILWAGSYSNIGFFKQNKLGEFNYTSLSELIPEGYSDFSEVYTIKETEDFVLFFSDLYLLQYFKQTNSIQVIEYIEYDRNQVARPTTFSMLNGKPLFFMNNGDVLTTSDAGWKSINYQGANPSNVNFTVEANDVLFLVDLELGLLTFDGNRIDLFAEDFQDFITESEPTDLTFLPNIGLVLATESGVLIFDESGNHRYTLNEKIGLAEDDLNGSFVDEAGDLWLTGEATVTKVYFSNPVRHFPGEALGFGDALHIRSFEDQLFIPAMEGLFRLNAPIKELYNQSSEDIVFQYPSDEVFWNTLIVEEQLWVASHDGVYKISGDELIPVVLAIEARQLRQLNERVVLVVTYNGLDWIKKTENQWVHQGTIKEVPEHILELAVVPNEEFWAGGVSGEVFNGVLNIDESSFMVESYSSEQGLPETDLYEPTFTNNDVIVNSKFGFSTFKRDKERFEPFESINNQLGNWGEYLRMDYSGNLWMLYANIEGYSGVIKAAPDTEKEWVTDFTPFEISPDHFGDFIEIENEILWVGSTESVMQLDLSGDNAEKERPVVSLWSIQSTFDQEWLAYSTNDLPKIDYSQRDAELSFISSSYKDPSKNEFRFKLNDEEWSEWRAESSLNINPFLPGVKEIAVQTRNYMRIESAPKVFEVAILAPWYLSNVAYGLYILLFLGLLGVAVRSVSSYRIKQQLNAFKLREIERIIELDELKTKLLINISHELRTPLTLVTGPVKQLLDSGKVDDGFLLRKLQVAHRNGRRLHELVEQVLDLSRLDSNIISFKPVEIPINSFINGVLQSFESQIEKKALTAELYLPDEEILFQADADKLEKILVNLLSNAVKFTPEKGTIILIVTNSSNELVIEVKDSGKGINKEDLDHVFDRFHSTSDQLEGGGQGIGVGLSITKEFVELHEGSISVDSETGKGATFTVTLPHKNYDQLAEYLPDAKIGVSDSEVDVPLNLSVNGKEYQALVVEDNPDMRTYITELLEQLNIRVEQAQNGLEGKKIISVKKPDIIISDIMMPEMNGFEFSAWMRSVPEFRHIPIILLSARSEVEDKVHGFQLGVSDYLTKPFNAQELQARVDNLLVLKKEREEAVGSNMNTDVLSADVEWVQQLQEWIEANVHKSDITVDDLADQAAMSTRNLQRSLKSVTGFSPSEFIREVRLYTARDLLETKQKRTVSEVAYAIGFSTPAYFSKQYKKRFGTSPAQYF